jgi:hypothetical protein
MSIHDGPGEPSLTIDDVEDRGAALPRCNTRVIDPSLFEGLVSAPAALPRDPGAPLNAEVTRAPSVTMKGRAMPVAKTLEVPYAPSSARRSTWRRGALIAVVIASLAAAVASFFRSGPSIPEPSSSAAEKKIAFDEGPGKANGGDPEPFNDPDSTATAGGASSEAVAAPAATPPPRTKLEPQASLQAPRSAATPPPGTSAPRAASPTATAAATARPAAAGAMIFPND